MKAVLHHALGCGKKRGYWLTSLLPPQNKLVKINRLMRNIYPRQSGPPRVMTCVIWLTRPEHTTIKIILSTLLIQICLFVF